MRIKHAFMSAAFGLALVPSIAQAALPPLQWTRTPPSIQFNATTQLANKTIASAGEQSNHQGAVYLYSESGSILTTETLPASTDVQPTEIITNGTGFIVIGNVKGSTFNGIAPENESAVFCAFYDSSGHRTHITLIDGPGEQLAYRAIAYKTGILAAVNTITPGQPPTSELVHVSATGTILKRVPIAASMKALTHFKQTIIAVGAWNDGHSLYAFDSDLYPITTTALPSTTECQFNDATEYNNKLYLAGASAESGQLPNATLIAMTSLESSATTLPVENVELGDRSRIERIRPITGQLYLSGSGPQGSMLWASTGAQASLAYEPSTQANATLGGLHITEKSITIAGSGNNSGLIMHWAPKAEDPEEPDDDSTEPSTTVPPPSVTETTTNLTNSNAHKSSIKPPQTKEEVPATGDDFPFSQYVALMILGLALATISVGGPTVGAAKGRSIRGFR